MRQYVYNPESLRYEERKRPKWLQYGARALFAAAAAASVALLLWVYLDVWKLELPKTLALKRQNELWRSRIELLERQADDYETVIRSIEERDDAVYRLIFGLDAIPDNVKYAGFGNRARYAPLEGAAEPLRRMVQRMDVLTRRVYVQSKALDEVAMVARQAGDMVSCVPAIPPIAPIPGTYHISSYFGFRADPIYGRTAFHEGVDFASDTGNPVYATGDATVEKVQFRYTGYGNEVVLDHGYGYKTRYAHLSTIQVGSGQKILRGQKIGEVGRSGKSTGPHLHYEVIYKGNRVNPMSFLDMKMPVSEYQAMVQKRSEEDNAGAPASTAALAERSRKLGANGKNGKP
ncbi:MAG: M23 family metallopeptidase [Bacteroidales bacterium]|nr:M23 family metallopeptidase [Bacteroidales bacterium]